MKTVSSGGIYHNVNPSTPWHARDMVSRVGRLMLRHGGRPRLGKLIYHRSRGVEERLSELGEIRDACDANWIRPVFWTLRMEERFGS